MTDVTDMGGPTEEPPRQPLFVAIAFHDTAMASGVRVPVGSLIVEETGRAFVMDTTGRETPEAMQAVLKLCEQLHADSAGKTEGERVLAALAHALVRRMACEPADEPREAPGVPSEELAEALAETLGEAPPVTEESVH